MDLEHICREQIQSLVKDRFLSLRVGGLDGISELRGAPDSLTSLLDPSCLRAVVSLAPHSVPENFQAPFGILPEICYELSDRPR